MHVEYEDGGTDKLDILDRCINSLHEKRRSTREAGMEGLVGLLEGFIPMDRIDYRCLTIFFRCRASLNKGSAREALLAYRAIGLLALTVGDNPDCSKEILTSTLQLPTLMKTLRSSSDDAKVAAALNCLAAVTFAATRRPEDVEPSIRAIWGVIKSSRADNRTNNPVVLITALSAWALLLTTLGDLRTYPYAWKEATIPFRDLAELLNTDDPTLLMAASEALAVCVELNLMQHASPEDIETLKIKVTDLASGTHGNDRKLAGQSRVMFQHIAVIVKQGHCFDEEVIPTTTSQRCVLMVSKWARLVQLNFIKRLLGKSFDKHIHDNPLFRESYNNVATNETSDLPVKKSKVHRFGTEKQWTVALKRDRLISW